MQARLNEQAVNYISRLRSVLTQLWRKACEYDDIPPDSTFAVFSPDNPYVKLHDSTLALYLEACRRFRDGGNGGYDA